MKKLKELALVLFTNIEKTYLIASWIVSVFRGDKFTMTISFTALLVLWYMDKKFEKKKIKTTTDGHGNIKIKVEELTKIN